jgi:hypothetical protein
MTARGCKPDEQIAVATESTTLIHPEQSGTPNLAAHLGSAVAWAGVNRGAGPRAIQDALKRAIACRRSYVDWDVDHARWVVELLRPERELFYGRTLEEALARCLVWLMRDELIGAVAG